ncbi:LOW QUALITY PROTEIN: hypothetical protein CVT25_001279 [Psilocybe cyanescens]|uniref:Uncharacterized protein n=1 Tax=Psilocybe cyanescens TaxID=93625 RepID=A0A409XEL0_PSICY|nr:LOW QUALITY PROTEIN: hypothetical protein CVT25_001279 [Psilocybe cyanescens]
MSVSVPLSTPVLHAHVLFVVSFLSAISLPTFSTVVTLPLVTVDADYAPDTVPDYIKDRVVENDVLFGDVVNAGVNAGAGLGDEEATDCGVVKNHWAFRAHLNFSQDGRKNLGQIQFGMGIKCSAGVGSDEGQYARSIATKPISE